MKKFIIAILVFIIVFIGGYFLIDCVMDKKDKKPEQTEEAIEPAEANVELRERLANATGRYTLRITGENTLTMSEESETLLGGVGIEQIVIEGVDGATITATGAPMKTVKAANGAELVFRNLTIEDETEDTGSAWTNYLWLGGRLVFENCTINDSIYLTSDVSATFVNCKIVSSQSKYYGAWVADGSATFEGCTFTGYRGLKIHEFEGGDDVVNVSINKCLFKALSEKPGIAIGEFFVEPLETTVSVTNSKFVGCQAWDTVGSLFGVDGFYECDTPLENFKFINENNEVEFTAE